MDYENPSTAQLIDEIEQLRRRVAELERQGDGAGLDVDRERLFQAMLDSCPATLYAKDLEGRYILVNQKAAEQIGRPKQAIMGLTNYDLYPRGVAAALEAIDRRIIETGEVVEREAEVAIGGQPTTQLAIKFPLCDPQGAIYAIGGVSTDISARVRAEEQLRESEEYYRLLFEVNPLPIWILDAAGADLVAVNAAAVQRFGYSRDEFLALRLHDLRPADELPELERRLEYVAANRPADGHLTPNWHIELEFRHKHGEPIIADVVVQPMMFRGRPAYLLVLNDLTARKRAEEALRQSQRQLMQSQRMESIGRLAGGIAHDFNNLLTAITGYGSLALDSLPPAAPQRDDLAEILLAAKRARELTHQLLAYGRRQILQPSLINLNDTVAEMERMLRRLIGEDIELVVDTDPDLRYARIDRSQLEQVLMNVVVNARDALGGAGQISVETANVYLDEAYRSAQHAEVKTGPYVMLAISDNGAGMDSEIQSQIFEPFFTTKPPGQGTGLGLSTVYGIVKQSGGYIWVYSEPGVGTTFKIYFPQVAAIDDQPDATHGVPAAHAPPARDVRGGERIMIVEDEEQVRALMQRVLSMHGYAVVTAPSGPSAMEAWSRSGRIDLLITDMVMPQMSGRELIATILLADPELKTLCISGYTDRMAQKHNVLPACHDFLQKPFTPAALARKVREILDTPLVT
ncbi:MAG TPA: PAS domain S-box protein [Herpetosiphonaceae bacterium]|nr:PAS domain S-box protein [Herpetosiphonaceae bacterium]